MTKQEDLHHQVKTTVQAIKDNAERLGLTWTRRIGTVREIIQTANGTVPMQVGVLLDAQDSAEDNQPCMCLVPVAINTRVVVDCIPPAGKFIVGTLGAFRQPRGLIARDFDTRPTVGSFTSVSEANPSTLNVSVTFEAARAYALKLQGYVQSTISQSMTFRARLDAVGGTVVGLWGVTPLLTANVAIPILSTDILLANRSGNDITHTIFPMGNLVAGTTAVNMVNAGIGASSNRVEVWDIGWEADFADAFTLS